MSKMTVPMEIKIMHNKELNSLLELKHLDFTLDDIDFNFDNIDDINFDILDNGFNDSLKDIDFLDMSNWDFEPLINLDDTINFPTEP